MHKTEADTDRLETQTNPTRRLYTLAEAAEQMGGLSVRTLRRMRDRGDVKTVVYGRRRFVEDTEIQRFIDVRTVGAK